MKRYLILLFVASLQLLGAKTGAIKGRVTDAGTGKAIVGVNVWITDSKQHATTNKKGDFLFKAVTPGRHFLNAAKNGYAPLKPLPVDVRSGKTNALKIKLTPVQKGAPEPPSLTKDVTPKLSGKPGETTESVDGRTSEAGSPSKPGDPPDRSEPKPDKKASDRKSDPEPSRILEFLSNAFADDDAMKVPASKSRPSETGAPPRVGRVAPPQAGGLKAGFADDNKQFNYFLNFLNKYKGSVSSYGFDISERLHLMFQDGQGKSLPNLEIKVFEAGSGQLLDQGVTYADGSFFLFPAELAERDHSFTVGYTINGMYSTLPIDRNGPRNIRVQADVNRILPQTIPVDIVFILDTTGSMGEEIKRLIATIDMIHMNLTALPNLPAVRFGMILYRDRGDEYVTRMIPLTSDIETFHSELERVEADGGGDTPEDLQAALEHAVLGMSWNRDGLRMGFVITDAAPHLDYEEGYTYIKAALEAKSMGIKLFSVGTGGLDINGELVLRQISQLTYAKYLFLTYGRETGENEGGVQGSVSHHTGANYQTDKLEVIINRLAKEEISYFTDEPLEIESDYFQADKIDSESREETLALLFHDAISQLVDFSTLRIEGSPKLGVLPIHSNTDKSELSAEYFSEQLQLAVAQNNQFTLIARKDLQKILEEQKLQLSGLLSDSETTQLGQLLGAELLLSAELYGKADRYELFLKLLRVETAEILAVTKIVLARELGL